MAGVLRTLAEKAGRVSKDDAAARRLARESLVDTLGCIVAGWSSAQSQSVSAMRAATGAHGAGGIALHLGTAAHALDYDDFEQPGSTHPSAVLIPAILAVASRQPVSLEQVECAYIAGYEVILALGTLLGYGHYTAGWHATSTLGAIGAAASVGRLLQLKPDAQTHAMSLAVTQAAGLKRQFGHDAKALHAGLAARNGVDAAFLAQAGIGAAQDIFEADQGFAALYGAPDPGALPDPLPTIRDHPPFRKLSPCCGYALRAIDAAIEIAGQKGFDPGAVQTVRIEMGEPYHHVVRFTGPRTAPEARFSVSYCVAAALCDGHVGQKHFHPEALTRPDLVEMERKVSTHPYALPPGAGDVSPDAPDKVTVMLQSGERLSASCAVQRGGAGRPLSEAALLDKMEDCGLARADAARLLALDGKTGLGEPGVLPGPIRGLIAP